MGMASQSTRFITLLVSFGYCVLQRSDPTDGNKLIVAKDFGSTNTTYLFNDTSGSPLADTRVRSRTARSLEHSCKQNGLDLCPVTLLIDHRREQDARVWASAHSAFPVTPFA